MEHWRRQIHHPRMLIFSQSDPPLQNIQGDQSYEVRRWPLQIRLERFKPSYFFLFFFVSCFLAKSFKCSIFQTWNFLFKLFTVVKRRGLNFFYPIICRIKCSGRVPIIQRLSNIITTRWCQVCERHTKCTCTFISRLTFFLKTYYVPFMKSDI